MLKLSRAVVAASRALHCLVVVLMNLPGEDLSEVSFWALRPRTESGDANNLTTAFHAGPRRGGLITVHELYQTIREIGQELSIDDACVQCFLSHRVR